MEGWAIATGIAARYVTAVLDAPEAAAHQAVLLEGTPNELVYQSVPLEPPGTVEITMTAEGEPLAAAECEILDAPLIAAGGEQPPVVLRALAADARGTCIVTLPEAKYYLNIAARSGARVQNLPITVIAGRNAEMAIHLERLIIKGVIQRGSVPEPDAEVSIVPLVDHKTAGEAIATATTDALGRYEAIVWSAGEYRIAVTNADGRPGPATVMQLGSASSNLDFNLPQEAIKGSVHDPDGVPIRLATVIWRDDQASYQTVTDDRGAFFFDLAPASGIFTIQREGYLAVDRDLPTAETPLADITLKPLPALRGSVITAAGDQVSETLVTTYDPTIDLSPLGTVTTGPTGEFALPAKPTGTSRLFASGTRCALLATIVRPGERATLVCPSQEVSLSVIATDAKGAMSPNTRFLLRQDGIPIPARVLTDHLARRGIRFTTNTQGRLLLSGLAPGFYELLSADGAVLAAVPLPESRAVHVIIPIQ